jgi:hypothetical protein
VETLEEEVARGVRPTASVPGAGRAAARAPGLGRREARISGLGPERQLLLVLLRDRTLVERALERIGPGEFRDPAYRAIFEALADHPDLQGLPAESPPEAVERFEALMRDPEEVEHTERIFHDTMAELEDRTLRDRQAAMTEEIRAASSEDEKRRLAQELEQLRRERAARWHSGRIRRGGPVGISGDDQRVNE